MDIQLILEISAIATLIGTGVSYFTFRKSSSLTYVTQERKEWREFIRTIAEKLEKCTYKERNSVLVHLKTRINVYGINTKDEVKDAHIWKLIREIEDCKKSEFNSLKKKMILYLSALLKYDWERSKNEVYGNTIKAVGQIFGLAAMFLFMTGFFQLTGENFQEEFSQLSISLSLFGAGLVVIFIWKNLGKVFSKDSKMLIYVNFIIRWILVIAIYIMSRFFVGRIANNAYIEAGFIAALSSIIALFWVEMRELIERKQYCELIQNIIDLHL